MFQALVLEQIMSVRFKVSHSLGLMHYFLHLSLEGKCLQIGWLVLNLEKNIVSPSTAAIFLAMISIICFTRGLRGTIQTTAFTEYGMSFNAYIFGGKSPIFLIKSILPFLFVRNTK